MRRFLKGASYEYQEYTQSIGGYWSEDSDMINAEQAFTTIDKGKGGSN